MFSKVYYYNDIKDLKLIKENIIKENNSCKIICENVESKKLLMKNGIQASFLDEFFPRYSNQNYKIFENGKNLFLKYKNSCKQIKFKDYSISIGLLYYLINEMLFVEKIKKIFENKTNTIFIFKKLNFRNLAIQKIANEMGFETNEKFISVVKNEKLYHYNLAESMENLENSQMSKYKNSFSIYSKNIPRSANKISFMIKLAQKTIPMIVRLFSSKIYELKPDEAIKSILKNVENKVSKDRHFQFGFFLASYREDLLEPNYEIFKKFSDAKIAYRIFTINPLTSSFLEKKHLPVCEFFEEIQILANLLKKTVIGKTFEDQLKRTAISDNLYLVYNEKMNPELIDGFYRVFATLMIFELILKTLNLKNAIITDGTIIGLVVSFLGKKLNFPTTSITTLNIDNNAVLSLLIKANKICTYGDQGQQSLVNLGIPKEKIAITGNPKYDYINSQNTVISKKILKQKYNIDNEKKIITIAMSRWHSNDEHWISNFIKFCNKNKIEIIIKLHPIYKKDPQDTQNKIDFIKKECKDNKFQITFDMKLSLLLSASDLVVSDNSNVAVEAVLLKKPVINQNFTKDNLEIAQNYHEIGAVLYTEEYAELEKMVKEIFYENKFRKQLEKGYEEMITKYNFKNDGKASDRIFNLLISN